MNFLLIVIGSALGILIRYILGSTFGMNYHYSIIMIINIVSCFLIGLLFGGLLNKTYLNKTMMICLMIGFCCGFSALSSYSLDVINIYRNGNYLLAFGYLLFTIIICILSTIVGIYAIKNVK